MSWHRIVQKAASIGRYLELDNWQQYVLVDNNLATGQNSGSSEASDGFADSWTTMAAHHSRSFAHRDTAVDAITDVVMIQEAASNSDFKFRHGLPVPD
jgi:hypothetical protein